MYTHKSKCHPQMSKSIAKFMQSLKRTNDQATKKYTIERNERKKECGMTKHIKRKVQSAQIPHWIECCEENEKKSVKKSVLNAATGINAQLHISLLTKHCLPSYIWRWRKCLYIKYENERRKKNVYRILVSAQFT